MIKEYGYEYDAVLQEKIWNETNGRVTEGKWNGAHCLRSGRDALKAIAQEYSPCVVLLPALSCDSMVRPFEQYNHEIRFYQLNADYSINMDDLKQKVTLETCLFLYMDYFGCQAISDAHLNELKKTHEKLVFIEDRTHNLIWERNSTFHPDYIMASLRKWIAIPDGGLLWGHITHSLNNDTSFSTTRLKAQCLRHVFFQTGNEETKKMYRQAFSTVSKILDDDQPCAMSAYSYVLTENVDWNQLRFQRKSNAEVLTAILAPYVHVISGAPSALYVPFLISNRDEVQRRLSKQGIFNTIIWPLSDLQKGTCGIARYTEEHMLAAPCDQRYTTEDMKFIGNEMVNVLEAVNG